MGPFLVTLSFLLIMGVLGLLAFLAYRWAEARERRQRISELSQRLARSPKEWEHVLRLTELLSGGDRNLVRRVKNAMEKPGEQLEKLFGSTIPEDAVIDPLYLALEALRESGWIAAVDRSATAQQVQHEVQKLLSRHGIHDFDWSFIKTLTVSGNWDALRADRLLNFLGEKIGQYRLVLAALQHPGDAYYFTILTPDQYYDLGDVELTDFAVRRHFDVPAARQA